jgi:hypothetical protein
LYGPKQGKKGLAKVLRATEYLFLENIALKLGDKKKIVYSCDTRYSASLFSLSCS